jgi:hypothetical protein
MSPSSPLIPHRQKRKNEFSGFQISDSHFQFFCPFFLESAMPGAFARFLPELAPFMLFCARASLAGLAVTLGFHIYWYIGCQYVVAAVLSCVDSLAEGPSPPFFFFFFCAPCTDCVDDAIH